MLHSIILDPEGKYHLSWNFTDTDVTFEVQVKTLGYIGLGISPNGGMPGSDIVLVWVDDATGIANISDRHAVAEAEPRVDSIQNYQVISGFQNDTHTVVKFQRDLEICDEEDNIITVTLTQSALYGPYRDKDPDADGHAMYHGIHRGSRSIFLLNSFVALPPKSSTTTTMDLTSDKIDPIIQDGHEMHVHHILIYGCLNNVSDSSFNVQHQCQHRNMPLDWWNCNALYFGWAIGGGSTYLPDHTGMPFGTDEDPTLLLMEIHYDNPQLKSGIVDSSGLRIIFTQELRQYDAGILSTGTNPGPTQIIPPYEPNFLTVTHCLSECYEEGVELNPIAEDMNYDFNLQDLRMRKREVTIRPGDHIVTECFYNTEKRSKVTLGGLRTTDEMCLAYLVYYPKIPLSVCQSVPRPSFLAKYGGVTVTGNWRVLAPPELVNQSLAVILDDLVDWTNTTIRKGFQALLKTREPYSYVSLCLHGSEPYSVLPNVGGPVSSLWMVVGSTRSQIAPPDLVRYL
ncbi:DBH-like monooxygenase protein 1 homolog [Liolophura sinensis]|uniref:DBH-like monooxygenase protein 1 homolog n=1 Tax=Liolophura sinensis TaxID=3198878 RepID=UPI0031596809